MDFKQQYLIFVKYLDELNMSTEKLNIIKSYLSDLELKG
uniref:Uncharacterized protein n=1 Tax=virus sp. ctrcb4 TaxID=2825824 RepID=A0A8S5RPB3_9VIRU|nr:MAG TPA: hypothetical protein [virus sp. ctrcb4]